MTRRIYNKNEITKKLTSLTLMAIMVAGGMTFAVPGMVPEAYAANANLFVSAENSLFDNYMSGPQVIEVVVRDSSISDTDEAKGEPNVTVKGNQLRMVQANDGNWYGYFADYQMVTQANDTGILSFGTFAEINVDGTADMDISHAEADELTFQADGLFYNNNKNVNVVREPKQPSSDTNGQIGIMADKWPFIQLYELSQGGNVVVQYNKGGGAQTTTLTFDTVDDFAGIELDRSSYPQGADVHATITDPWLNIDPTDEDSWTFATADKKEAIFYQIFDERGKYDNSVNQDPLTNAGDLMCEDGCVLKLDTAVQGDSIITLQDNDDSVLLDESQDIETAYVPKSPTNKKTITGLGPETQPITISEKAPNSGIFTTYDENDKSVIKITDKAARGTSATIDYNDSPQSVLVTHAFAEIDIQPASDVWNSGELIPVVLVDADANKNSRSDETIDLSDPSSVIPSLRTGSPITLGSGADSNGQITVSYDGTDNKTDVNAFSDRAILNDNVNDRVSSILIDLGITGEELKASLVDTNKKNYGYNLFNYDISSLTEDTVNISLVDTDNGTPIDVDLACNAKGSGLQLLNGTTCDELTSIILLYDAGDAYEMQHFGTAFDKAVTDNDYVPERISLGTTPIQAVLDTGALGAVGTYTSQQLQDLNDTGKVGTGVGDIVLLSYSSAATSFAEPGDGIFRLTTDTSRQVESVITQLIPVNFDNIISIHLDDAWSNDYVDALAEEYGANHKTIAYNSSLTGTALTAEFASKFTGLSGLDAQTAIVILEYNHDRLDALVTELARTGAYAGIATTKFIIPDVQSAAFGDIGANAINLLQATDMKTIKFALSDNTAGQTALKDALLKQSPKNEVKLDSFGNIFDRHAYAAYDAGQILTRAIDALPTGYTAAQLNAQIPKSAEAYSSEALIYNTKLNDKGDLACMVYDIFEIDDNQTGFTLQQPMQATTHATNCSVTNPVVIPTAPNTPTALHATLGDTTVTLMWTAPAGDVTGYKVQQSTDGTTFTASTFTITGTTAIVTGLTNDQAYTFRVIATNTVGDSTPVSMSATPREDPNTPNVAPVIDTIEPQTATAGTQVTFTVVATDPNPADSDAIIFTLTAPQGITSNPNIDSNGVFTWTPDNTDVGPQAFAFMAEDDDGSTTTVTVTITVSEAPTAPNAPTSLTATAGDGEVSLSWTAPTTGDAPTSYKVEQSTDGTTFTASTPATATGTTVTVTGLTNGQQYHFKVTATNSVGDSATASNVVTATPVAAPTVPAAPTGLTATAGDATVALSWTASPTATSYKVEQSTDGTTFTASTPATATGTTVTVTGLTNGQQYHFKVTATNSVGDSATASNVVTATPVAAQTVPAAPTGLTATAGDATVALSWTASPTATSYKVEQSTDGTTFTASTPATATGTTVTVTGLTNGQQYHFKVTATNSVGDSATASNVVTATPVAAATNNPPVFKSVIPQSTTVGTAVSFTVEATDADTSDELIYNVIGTNGAVNPNTGVFTWIPTTAGTQDIVFTVSDGSPDIVRLTVEITVYPVRVAFTGNINIPMLYDIEVNGYEQRFFDAFGQAVGDYDNSDDSISTTYDYYDVSYDIAAGDTTDIDTIVNADHKGVVGTYTSEQLEKYKDESRIVFLSYASTASTLTADTDNIFRLTVDNKRQTADVLKPQLDADGIVNVISIHRNDAWSSDFVAQLQTEYGNNHKTIPYDSTATNQDAEIMSKVTTATVGTIAANTAIVILGFEEVEHVIDTLSMQATEGTYDYTGIENTKIFIPDASFDTSQVDDDGLALLKATDMKTIKFALSGNDVPVGQLFQDAADRHVYAAYDAGQILTRSIDQLGKDYTAEQLKTKIPEVARAYSDDALIYRTVLDANGDLECMVYDVLEIADDATAASFTYKDAVQRTTDATNCPISAGTSSSSTILSNPQTVSCIDCAINSFGEIFGQTVQVQQTVEPVTELLKVPNNSNVGILIEYHNKGVRTNVMTDAEADPIVLDFFAFGFGDDGRTANQIVRLLLEETDDNTSTFTGGLEYIMLNQLNILDDSTYTGLDTISDEPTFIVMEDLTDEDSPRVNYLDLGEDGVSTQIADQQEAPSHSGVVSLDSESYKVADTVIITLTDADLNVDSDLIDIFTVVKNGSLADTIGKDVSKSYGKNITESGASLGRVLDVTFDDQKWTVNNCTPKDGFDDGLADTGFTLIETEKASGIFTGSFQIPTEYCRDDATKDADGNYVRESVTGTDIEINYLDYRDASGEIIEVGDSAGVRANTGSVSLDRTVYPVPYANGTFSLHASAGQNQYLDEGKVMLHVRISDPDYDISASGEDKIAQDKAPIKVTVSRGQDSKLVYTAGANTANDNRVMEIDGKNRIVPEYGPITEVKGDSGIFEADIPISYKSGPNATATDTACPVYPNQANNIFKDGCVLQGDIITVEYTDPTDASGEPNSVTDSATFDLRNAVLQSDKSVYIIGSDMILTLIEPDFDLDNDGAETYSLDLIEWDSDAATTSMGERGGDNAAAFDPEPSAFRETGDSTGIFQVVVEIPEALDGDKLERGEEIELEYTDWGPSGSNYVGDEDEDINLTVFTSNFGSTVELDQKVYTWTDKVYITIVAPDHNFDSDLVDEIGNTGDDPIRIATRGADLDQYKLVETGTDTGIFTGEVTLTGFAHDVDGDNKADVTPKTSGNGPTDGFLETEDDDGLSVSFEFSEDETVIGSSLIRWNIGEVQWLEASYAASGTGVVRVIDPDMNLNPESVDNFEVNIWSDSDVGGIDLTVTETNQATGIFEGTTFFTVSDTSSGHRLRVSEGDTVTAEYNDRTLPDPHDTSDEIDITATTQIGSIIPPLERAPATNLRVVDAFSNTLDTISVDQQVQITADLANGQDKEQPFAYIVQIQNEGSVTVALAWVSGTLTPSQSFSPALSWTPSEAGTYTATAFVWESVDNPTALSPPSELTITVN